MFRNLIPLTAVMALGSGCIAGSNGIYTIFIFPGDPPDTTVDIDHNYLDASPLDDTTTSDWTFTNEVDASPQVVFGQIFDVDGEDAKILVVQDTVFFGNKSGGIWEFTWTNSEDERDVQSHNSGYTYESHDVVDYQTVIEVDLGGGTGTGSIRSTVTSTQTYDENDLWDGATIGQYTGDTPAGYYLYDSFGSPVWNYSDATDCAGNPCNLVITSTTTFRNDIEVRDSGLDPEDYDGVMDAGQPQGVSGF